MTHEDALQLISVVRWCQFNTMMITIQIMCVTLLLFGLRR